MDLEYFCREQPEEKAAIASEKEAKQLKRDRWAAAGKLGIPQLLIHIAKTLGFDPASINKYGQPTGCRSTCGPKRVFKVQNVTIYWDGYGGYTDVDVDKKSVYSSHFCEQRIVPGEWLRELLKFKDEADAKAAIADVQRQAQKLSDSFNQI